MLLFLAVGADAFGYMSATQYETTTFVPYYTYTGNLSVAGSVTGRVEATTLHFTVSLTGTDPDCANGASDVANSCGIHFHAGQTCSGDA